MLMWPLHVTLELMKTIRDRNFNESLKVLKEPFFFQEGENWQHRKKEMAPIFSRAITKIMILLHRESIHLDQKLIEK